MADTPTLSSNPDDTWQGSKERALNLVVTHKNTPLDDGRHKLNPKTDLGQLDTLPLELLQEILLQIDVKSITDFRRLNRRAMQVVDSIPQYQAIIDYGKPILRCILALQVANLVSCQDLRLLMIPEVCENCQHFGGYFYLPTCSRICFDCVLYHTSYLPLTITEMHLEFALPRDVIPKLPSFRTVPGTYLGSEYKSRRTLYEQSLVRKASKENHGSDAAMEICYQQGKGSTDSSTTKRSTRWCESSSTSNNGIALQGFPRPQTLHGFHVRTSTRHDY